MIAQKWEGEQCHFYFSPSPFIISFSSSSKSILDFISMFCQPANFLHSFLRNQRSNICSVILFVLSCICICCCICTEAVAALRVVSVTGMVSKSAHSYFWPQNHTTQYHAITQSSRPYHTIPCLHIHISGHKGASTYFWPLLGSQRPSKEQHFPAIITSNAVLLLFQNLYFRLHHRLEKNQFK